MNGFYFKDRDGQTLLPPELQKGLIPQNVYTLGELDEHEEASIALGLVWLEKHRKDDYLNYEFWTKLHEKLFKRVWRWAGEIRSHELSNPYFRLPHQVRPELKKLEGDIQYWLEHSTYPTPEAAARFHERIEAIHPFANGNGRFGRILTEYICQRRGHVVPTWGEKLRNHPPARRRAYIDALNHARDARDHAPLVDFMFS